MRPSGLVAGARGGGGRPAALHLIRPLLVLDNSSCPNTNWWLCSLYAAALGAAGVRCEGLRRACAPTPLRPRVLRIVSRAFTVPANTLSIPNCFSGAPMHGQLICNCKGLHCNFCFKLGGQLNLCLFTPSGALLTTIKALSCAPPARAECRWRGRRCPCCTMCEHTSALPTHYPCAFLTSHLACRVAPLPRITTPTFTRPGAKPEGGGAVAGEGRGN